MKNRLTLNDERLKSMDGDGYVKEDQGYLCIGKGFR